MMKILAAGVALLVCTMAYIHFAQEGPQTLDFEDTNATAKVYADRIEFAFYGAGEYGIQIHEITSEYGTRISSVPCEVDADDNIIPPYRFIMERPDGWNLHGAKIVITDLDAQAAEMEVIP